MGIKVSKNEEVTKQQQIGLRPGIRHTLRQAFKQFPCPCACLMPFPAMSLKHKHTYTCIKRHCVQLTDNFFQSCYKKVKKVFSPLCPQTQTLPQQTTD